MTRKTNIERRREAVARYPELSAKNICELLRVTFPAINMDKVYADRKHLAEPKVQSILSGKTMEQTADECRARVSRMHIACSKCREGKRPTARNISKFNMNKAHLMTMLGKASSLLIDITMYYNMICPGCQLPEQKSKAEILAELEGL